MSSLCLVDGREAGLDPRDRGLQYGDGVFRTLRVAAGVPLWWDEHLAKLAQDAGRLAITCPEPALWAADLAALAGRLGDGVVKLILTRGSAARGYRPPVPAQPCRIVRYDPAPPGGPAWPATGISLRVCDLRLAEQPRLAGVKHLNRLENVLARAEWDDPDIHEGVLLDASGRVVSGVMSNLFIWRDGRLLTPRLDRCGVAGVARDRLLRRAAAAGIAVAEAGFGLDELLAAEAVLVSNSVVGLARVARLGTRTWPQPGAFVRLQELFDA